MENWKESFPHTLLAHENTTLFWIPSIQEIPQSFWTVHNQARQIWFRALELSLPKHMKIGYLAFVQKEQLIAVNMIQLIDIPFQKLNGNISDWILPILSSAPYFAVQKEQQLVIRAMVAGDLFLTDPQYEQRDPALLHQAMHWLEQRESNQGTIALQVIKEFSANQQQAQQPFLDQGYCAVPTEPEMVLYLESQWKKMEDYLQAMTRKYRQRYRSARKKGAMIQHRLLNQEEIFLRQEELQLLLDAVLARSTFCLTPDRISQYLQYKKELGDSFLFRLYELDGKAVGFSTAIHRGDQLIAHRIGMDYRINQSHKLYQNMLYDYVESAFGLGSRKIRYGRTAMEIKSAIGAEPQALHILMRHPVGLPNQLLKWLLRSVPQNSWTQRHPFRHRPAPKKQLPLYQERETSCCLLKWLSSLSCTAA